MDTTLQAQQNVILTSTQESAPFVIWNVLLLRCLLLLQARAAVREKYLSGGDDKAINSARRTLMEYFTQFQ